MQRLIDIQQRLKAPKGQYNSFGGYSYRSCEDVLEAVKPLLNENEVTLTLSDTIENIGEFNYVRATATLTGVTGDIIKEATAYAREDAARKGMDAPQITGSASSYARKYALNALFLIDDVKDPDSTNTHGKTEPKEVKPEKPQFSKDATAAKRANTMAVKKSVATGEDLPIKPVPTSAELEEKGKRFEEWYAKLGEKGMSNSEIDYINSFIDELERAGLKAKAIDIKAKRDKKIAMDDTIPDFGDDN